ncbi:uncharacterized protein LOC134018271 [Osmerus eperlanus]|uniref:uncharacterized protein LOC134018271 n=1 Tax=Osmerus eperlanus TaxID=29151 RepID=UPI002E1181FA
MLLLSNVRRSLALVRIARHQFNFRVTVGNARIPCFHGTFSTDSAGVKVLYDGECPICVKEIRFLQYLQRNRPSKVDFVDISLPGYDQVKYQGISYEMAMKEMTVIDGNNKVQHGVPAFKVMYTAVGLGWLGHILMWPPVKPFMDKSYAIFARNRLKWTGRDECSSGRCVKKEP